MRYKHALIALALVLPVATPAFAGPRVVVTPSPSVSASPSSSPSLSPSPSVSAKPKSRIAVTQIPTVVVTSQTFTITGTVKPLIAPSPSASPIVIKVRQQIDTKWQTIGSAKVSSAGAWSIALVAPAQLTHMPLQFIYGASRSSLFDIRVTTLPAITVAGPGARISGVDISRFQHSSLPIDFPKMAKSGVAFVILKGSDGLASEDTVTRSFALADTAAVRAAGMYVGFYHFARIPRSNSRRVVIQSAKDQSVQALARLAELGGYSGYTLPYVLDIESAPKTSSAASVTLWARTWLDAMFAATGRRSIVYSYRSFLAKKFTSDQDTVNYLRQSPLWLAHPGHPENPRTIPGHVDSGVGCYQTAWTLPDCTATWSFWQYTSKGDREQYGIPWSPTAGQPCPSSAQYCSLYVGQSRKHLDLDVFSGSITDLVAMAQGTWVQTPKPNPTPSPAPNPTPTP